MTHNNITGDKIATKAPTKAYRDGWEKAFGKKVEDRKQDTKLGRDLPSAIGENSDVKLD